MFLLDVTLGHWYMARIWVSLYFQRRNILVKGWRASERYDFNYIGHFGKYPKLQTLCSHVKITIYLQHNHLSSTIYITYTV